MILLDSDIVIYSTKPEFTSLRLFVAQQKISVSLVSFVEVLGFHELSAWAIH